MDQNVILEVEIWLNDFMFLQSVDPLIGYLDTSLDILYEKLESIIFPLMLEQIWYELLYAFRDTLQRGVSRSKYS